MLTFTLRRLLLAIPTLLFISRILDLAPSDPTASLPLTTPPDVRADIRASLGLDEPMAVRLALWLFRDTLRQAFGPENGIFILIVFVIGITSWMQAARIVRGDVLALKEREFVLAARSIGTSPHRVIIRHVLPNVMSPILVSATLGIANAIITESALSFLGLGFPSDYPTWGRLLFDGTDWLQRNPERVIWPGLAISLTVLSVNYIGDGLRDALDPRIRGR